MSGQKRKTYDAQFKVQVVLESMQRDTTIEQVRIKYGIRPNLINKWRGQFKQNAHSAFAGTRARKKIEPKDSPEILKRIIGDLTIENELLKKALSVWD
jgi:transposase-like protein